MKKHISHLRKLSACPEAVEYAKGFKTLQETWDACERGDWMLWLLSKQSGEPGTKSRKKLVSTACKCARLSLKYVPKDDKRPLKAIQTAEKYAKGVKGITLQDVIDAADANAVANAVADAYAYAAAAYAAAYAASDAAYAAAYAASDAADAAYAAYVASDAAAAAASDAAASDAYAASDAAYAAREKTLKKCANIVKKDYPKIKMI